jgi:general secretion pathway protein E
MLNGNSLTDRLKGFSSRFSFSDGGKASPPAEGPEGNMEASGEVAFEEISAGDFPEKSPGLNGVSPRFMKQWKFVPVSSAEGVLKVAMASPGDIYLREQLASIYGLKIVPLLASEEDIYGVIYRWYEADVDIEGGDEDIDLLDADLWDDPEQLKDLASEAPVIRLVNHMITQAIEVKASDIHFEPYRDCLKVRFRIDGVLHEVETVAKKLQPAITSRIKLMGKMNIAEIRLPQDGRIKVNDGSREIDIRVSSLPTLFGESIVLRLLNREEVSLDLDTLGLGADILVPFNSIIQRPYGMVLVTGPTGSGKTTTLYSVMNRINSPDKKIVTVEDPVEYQLDGINQIQVKSKIGLTFSSALRTILRQDPDVILIGEIRDAETAEIAVQSALTGHLVFSTLHTNDSASAITRLQEMGVESYLLSSCLLAVMAQRLVRKICPHCKREQEVKQEYIQDAAEVLGVEPSAVPERLWKGEGCQHCANTGYSGRTGIYELLPVSGEIARFVLNGSDSGIILREAVRGGMRTLRQDGIERAFRGDTTIEEVMRVTN